MSKTRIDLTPEIENVANRTVIQMVDAVKQSWVDEAKNRLKTTANSYVSGINSRVRMSSSGTSGEVYLEGIWANKLEHGFGAYDMKPFFARSNKRKISKDGEWYMHIAKRFYAPTATGRSGALMPNSVYNKARQMPQWGRLESKGGSPSWGKYNGMTKVPESPTSSRSAYKTFRTVSANSEPSAFVHPGFEGVHIARDLGETIEDTFMKLFGDNLKEDKLL